MHPSVGELSVFPGVLYAAEEIRTSPAYEWANARREPPGTLVIQRTVEGTVHLEAAGRIRRVEPDRAMLFRYGEPSRYFLKNREDCPYRHEYVVISPRGGADDLVRQMRKDFGDVVEMKGNGESARILSTLTRHFREGQPREVLFLAEQAYRLIISLYREQVNLTEHNDPVAFLRHRMEIQFRTPLNVSEWTRDLALSREHLTRLFHERYGETPAACLRRHRLDHARLLAETTRMDADEIARASGFSNTQTLRRAFRKRFGRPLGSFQSEDQQPRAVIAPRSA